MKSVKVSDYMTRKLITFRPSTPLFEAMNTMLDERISGAPVVDEGGHLIGVLSEIDFLEEVLKRSYHGSIEGTVSEVRSSFAVKLAYIIALNPNGGFTVDSEAARFPDSGNPRGT